jgi:hypothetical protein
MTNKLGAVARSDESVNQKADEIRKALLTLAHRLKSGDESELFVTVIPHELACAHRPLRYHPIHGKSRADLPPEATDEVIGWVDRVTAAGFRSVICLMHPKEIQHYSGLDLGYSDILDLYRAKGLKVCHQPWDDPAHRPTGIEFQDEVLNSRAACLNCFDELPKPVLLHCSAGQDRSSPVAAFIWRERSEHALA